MVVAITAVITITTTKIQAIQIKTFGRVMITKNSITTTLSQVPQAKVKTQTPHMTQTLGSLMGLNQKLILLINLLKPLLLVYPNLIIMIMAATQLKV